MPFVALYMCYMLLPLHVLTVICMTWTIPVGVFFTSIIGWQYFVGRRTVQPGKCYVQYMDDAVFNCVLQVRNEGHLRVTIKRRKTVFRAV